MAKLVEVCRIVVEFLQDKRKYRKRRAKYQPIFLLVFSESRVTMCQVYIFSARLFRVTCNNVSGIYLSIYLYIYMYIYIYISTLNYGCQELDPTRFTVSLVPTWWIFSPPCEFYPTWRILPPIPKISETR